MKTAQCEQGVEVSGARNRKAVFVAVTLVLAGTLLLVSCKDDGEMAKAEMVKKAPDFSLKDLEGNMVKLSDHAGKVVVLDFWASWCHACKEAAPVLESIHQKHKDDDFILLGITLDSGFGAEENVRTFVEKFEQTYPMLWDDKKTSDAYGVIKIPTTYILDREHVIVDRLIGFLPGLEKKMEERISEELAKPPLR
jgi:thiol-disulfide isomerase/thioredoxin